MKDVTVYMKDGTKRKFEHRGRSGGSYSISTEYKEGWFVLTDEYGHVTAIPMESIKEVKETNLHTGW